MEGAAVVSRGIDRSLRVVVAAARAGSLSSAAHDLAMTQAAVSQAVKRAERAVGARLFDRSRSGVQLTEAGAALLSAIGSAYDTIDEAVVAVGEAAAAPAVAISVSTSFATWWLLPRLPEFKRQHPDVALRLVTTDTDLGVDLGGLDLWVPLGPIDQSGVAAEPLCAEVLVPVAAPQLAGRAPWPPERLLAAPLLHLEERYRPRFDWLRWFAHHGIEVSAKLGGDRTTDYSLVLHSALQGQGVALGWQHLVGDLIADGRLVALADPVRTETPFVVLHSTDRALSGPARLFRRWMIDTMQASMA